MRPFVSDYLNGLTPSPCVACNSFLKFDKLVDLAKSADAEKVATGHYARVVRDEKSGRWLLLRAVNRLKDQSYFLFELTQEQLGYALFPLGEMTKQEVRAIAEAAGLLTAMKPESQEICFVPGGDYRDALRERAGWSPTPGPLLDRDGVSVEARRFLDHHHRVRASGQRGARRDLQGVAADLADPSALAALADLTEWTWRATRASTALW